MVQDGAGCLFKVAYNVKRLAVRAGIVAQMFNLKIKEQWKHNS